MVHDSKYHTITTSDRVVLEVAQAREIYGTYLFTKNRVLVNKQCQYAAKWFGNEGSKRILGYVKRLDLGELQ